MPKIEVCSYYYNKDSMHAKFEQAYTIHDQPSILEKLLDDSPIKQKYKYVQFVIIFHLLSHGYPMIDYEDMNPLKLLLKVKNLSKNIGVITLVGTWQRACIYVARGYKRCIC